MSDLHARLSAVLADIAARADAATEGPWEAFAFSSVYPPADAVFIAAARSDVPRMAAALTATLDEHPLTERVLYGSHSIDWCTLCRSPQPCRTVRLIADALGVDVTG